MRAHQPPLAQAWTWPAILLVYALRAAFERHVVPFLKSLRAGPPTTAAMRRFIHALLAGEAILDKLIRNAAARQLGLPQDHRPWRAFRRPMPHNGFRTLIAVLRRYERLLRDPERAIRRRIARIAHALATSPLAAMRADAAALAPRISLQTNDDPAAPAALKALTPLAVRPP